MNKPYLAYTRPPSDTSEMFVASMNDFAKKSEFSEVVQDKDLLDNDPMGNEITRNELNAEIKAIEARIDSRFAELHGDIKAYMAEGRERDKRIELIAISAEKAAASASNLKGHLWAASIAVVIAAVGTVVAAYFATQQSNIGITQSVISAFQQGQSSPPQTPSKK